MNLYNNILRAMETDDAPPDRITAKLKEGIHVRRDTIRSQPLSAMI